MASASPKVQQLRDEIRAVQTRILQQRQLNLDTTLVNVSESDQSVTDLMGPEFRKPRKFMGHTGKIYDAHFCQGDGRSIVSAGQEGNLLIWDGYYGDKKQVIQLEKSSMWVLACAFSDSGRLVASGGLDNLCTVHDVEQNQPPVVLKGHKGFISHIRFLDDNKLLTSSGDGQICLWDVQKKKITQRFKGHSGDVASFEMLTKNTMVSGSLDRTVRTWDLRVDSGPTSTMYGHENDINDLCIHPSGNALGTCSSDGTARLWDIRADQQIEQYTRNGHDDEIDDDCHTIAFSKSGRLMFLGSSQKMKQDTQTDLTDEPDNDIMIWDTLTGDLFMDKKLQRECGRSRVASMSLSPDGYALLTAGWDSVVRVWSM